MKRPDLVQVERGELTTLRQLARAHEAYRQAAQYMSARQREMLARRDEPEARGWLQCLMEFDRAVLNSATPVMTTDGNAP